MIKVSELEYQSIDIIQYGKYRDTRTQEKKINSISRTYGSTSGFNTCVFDITEGERRESKQHKNFLIIVTQNFPIWGKTIYTYWRCSANPQKNKHKENYADTAGNQRETENSERVQWNDTLHTGKQWHRSMRTSHQKLWRKEKYGIIPLERWNKKILAPNSISSKNILKAQ